ncbi:neprilysin-1-like isoform X2 [Dermacentor albipictus]|uniref:neprilysin-1-like isoform X2 n=1 Tax=Dermacentor albipictus TaxID=60249 RepID=UPI0031FC75BF
MESKGQWLRKQRFIKSHNEEALGPVWIILPLVCLFVVVLVVLCAIFQIIFMLCKQSPDEAIIPVDTLAPFDVERKSMPDIKRPSEEHQLWSSPAQVNRSLTPARIAPTLPTSRSGVCTTFDCRYAAQWLRSKLDYSVDPCKDFYKFVCGSFRGFDAFSHLARGIEVTTKAFLGNLRVPSTNQNSQQKAAGMYQACVAFALSGRNETTYLVKWMISLNLDLMNQTRLAAVNPVEMMIEYSREQKEWMIQRSSEDDNFDYYARHLQRYGVNPPEDMQLASKIIGYERQLRRIAISQKRFLDYIQIRFLGKYTKPYVTSDEWSTFISTYTNGTYNDLDYIKHDPLATNILVKLFQNKAVGENGLRYLVAWSIYRQLVTYTVPELLFGRRRVTNSRVKSTCYELVGKVMHLAVNRPFFESHVPLEAVDQAKRMFTKIRGALRKSFESSSWFNGWDLEVALRKLDSLIGHVGSGNRLDPQFVEKHYKQYPDALPDQLFPVWIKARSLSSHNMWADQTSWFYDESVLNAFYNYLHNTLVVPRALLLRPFFRPVGPLGLNYAGLGAIMGHEMMHAFDVEGIMYNEEYEPWDSIDIIKEYTKKAVCLRQSHRSVLSFSARREALNDTVDSENMADLVGAMTAYATFASLPPAQANVTLVGLDMSAERLFFVNHCVMWCHEYGTSHVSYAPDRSRCIVPLMNMPEFASAFGCALGEPMNPRKKCNFWQ